MMCRGAETVSSYNGRPRSAELYRDEGLAATPSMVRAVTMRGNAEEHLTAAHLQWSPPLMPAASRATSAAVSSIFTADEVCSSTNLVERMF